MGLNTPTSIVVMAMLITLLIVISIIITMYRKCQGITVPSYKDWQFKIITLISIILLSITIQNIMQKRLNNQHTEIKPLHQE